MAKKLKINGTVVGADSQDVEYTNASLHGVQDVKGAIDELVSLIGSQAGTPLIKMAVLGDSTATDNAMGAGALIYHNKISIYKWLARWLNVKSYTNLAAHGNVLATMYGSHISYVPVDTNMVFIQIGINNIHNDTTPTDVGYASTVMTYECNDAKGTAIDVEHGGTMTENGYDARLKDTLIGYYRLCLDYLRKKCGDECKIYCVSPLFNNGGDGTGATRAALKQFREELHNLVDAMNTEEGMMNYIYISGLMLGVDASNKTTMYADGTHPNDTGAKYIAENLLGSMCGLNISPSFAASESTVNISTVAGTPTTVTYTVSGLGLYEWKLSLHTGQTGDFSVSPSIISTPDGRLDETTITVTFSPSSTGNKNTYVILNGSPSAGYVKLQGTAT